MKSKFIPLMAVLAFVCIQGFSVAQKSEADGPVGIFDSGSEYDAFMGSVKQAAYGEGGNAELQAMVPMLNDIALNKPVGWTANEYGVGGSTLGLLADADIRRDLEMMDDQYEELKTLNAAIQKRAAEQIRELDFSDRENLASQIRKIRDAATEELNGVLLPHQIERLQQLGVRAQLRRRSLVQVLTSDPVKTTLEITDEQSDALKAKEKEIEAELEREIAALREKAREKLLSSLRPTQKQAVEKMLGASFEFKSKKKFQKKK